jgi:acid phosphatase
MAGHSKRSTRSQRRRRRQIRKRIGLVAGSLLVIAALAALVIQPPAFLRASTDATPSASPRVLPTPAPVPTPVATPTPLETPVVEVNDEIDKALVFVLENHSAAQIRSGAPRLSALADKFGTAPRAVAPCGHPSQPNYVCLSAGGKYLSSNQIKTLSQPDIWNNTLAAGRAMKVYADNLPGSVRDRRKDVGKYAGRHVFTVPFVSTKEKADNFVRYTVHSNTLTADVESGALPNIGAVIPDNCHNSHDRCPGEGSTQLKQADDWIADNVQLLQGGPDWKSGRLLIIVTADEDNKNGTNDIPMIVIHPSLKNYSTDVPVDLYSVGGLLADLGHTPRLGKQRTAPDFAKAFKLPIAPAS